MIELIATVIITASSVLLFGYWFRYTCLLILSAKTTRDFAGEVAASKQLGFLDVQSQLRSNPADLGRLCDALDRDYAALSNLLKQMGDRSAEGSSIEKRMLELNYHLTRAWYAVSSQFSATVARRALEEMSMVVEHFANIMGEQAASAAAA
jgi:Skp family chaperone for outer membrane proteins